MLSQSSQSKSLEQANYTDLGDRETTDQNPKIGFTRYAETLNGRLAMLGFTLLLAIAVLNKHGLIN